MVTRAEFHGLVAEALSHFYDLGYLEAHPLAELVVPQDGTRESRGQPLREALLEAVDALRPADRLPPDRPEWLIYHVISMRYVDCRELYAIMEELAIGRTSFFKYQRIGLASLANRLWDRRPPNRPVAGEQPPNAAAAVSADEEAARIAQQASRQPLRVHDLVARIEQTLRPLARQQGVEVTFSVPPALPLVYGDPAMLRQAILNLLIGIVEGSGGGAIAVGIALRNGEVVWTVRRTGAGAGSALSGADGVAISKSLLRVYGGRLWAEQDAPPGTAGICIALPALKPKLVLAIDDDSGTVSLYRRYLQPYGYDLAVAGSGEEAWDTLQRVEPSAILLDVLMPREDGWEVLQRLRAMPETREIPVLVCSVLSEPRLALALGADAVLQKPFDQDVLAQALSRLLGE